MYQKTHFVGCSPEQDNHLSPPSPKKLHLEPPTSDSNQPTPDQDSQVIEAEEDIETETEPIAVEPQDDEEPIETEVAGEEEEDPEIPIEGMPISTQFCDKSHHQPSRKTVCQPNKRDPYRFLIRIRFNSGQLPLGSEFIPLPSSVGVPKSSLFPFLVDSVYLSLIFS